ncbi:MAG: hypothetical protein NVSMB66_6800 [Candidatus Doudnabacteria bacterium]
MLKQKQQPKNKAFTLLELLIVISIIGLLASIVIASASKARLSARNSKRITDLKQIQTALELYYNDNGGYPNAGWGWRSQCSGYGGYTSANVIPGLVPQYMSNFPSDPTMNISTTTSCYLYLSNGLDYKLLDHNITADFSPTDYFKYPQFVDPTRDGGTNPCLVDGNAGWSLQVSSYGGTCW